MLTFRPKTNIEDAVPVKVGMLQISTYGRKADNN